MGQEKKGGRLKRLAIYICPVFNVIAAFAFAALAFLPDETIEKLKKK